MTKSLFEDDENQPDEIKSEAKEDAATGATSETLVEPRYVEVNEGENMLEIPEMTYDEPGDSEIMLSDKEIENIRSFMEQTSETTDFSEPQIESHEELFAPVADETVTSAPPVETAAETESYETPVAAKTLETQPKNSYELPFQSTAKPESFAETARKSGLAYAAAITLFGAIVFMLIIGWFADLLFGSSPLGVVGGIILGSIIGFIQFFRMTSQILKNKD